MNTPSMAVSMMRMQARNSLTRSWMCRQEQSTQSGMISVVRQDQQQADPVNAQGVVDVQGRNPGAMLRKLEQEAVPVKDAEEMKGKPRIDQGDEKSPRLGKRVRGKEEQKGNTRQRHENQQAQNREIGN